MVLGSPILTVVRTGRKPKTHMLPLLLTGASIPIPLHFSLRFLVLGISRRASEPLVSLPHPSALPAALPSQLSGNVITVEPFGATTLHSCAVPQNLVMEDTVP